MYKNSIGYFGSLVYQCTNVKYIFIKINGLMKTEIIGFFTHPMTIPARTS